MQSNTAPGSFNWMLKMIRFDCFSNEFHCYTYECSNTSFGPTALTIQTIFSIQISIDEMQSSRRRFSYERFAFVHTSLRLADRQRWWKSWIIVRRYLCWCELAVKALLYADAQIPTVAYNFPTLLIDLYSVTKIKLE